MQTEEDSTDRNPHWCTVPLGPARAYTMLTEQCPHAPTNGRYVVQIHDELHGFVPNTKMQALFWINGRQERRERIRWLCYECSQVMPLGSYEG
jgi:hypothetical protein